MPVARQPKLDPESLRTFVTVAQLRSFSAAAELLHKTTSAISYRIRTLEDTMGAPLFSRTTRTVNLTPSGEVLLEKASQIFEWLQALPEELKQINDGVEPHFNVVINNILFESEASARLLAGLHKRFPHTIFKLRRAVYMGVWDELLHQGGHVAIGAPGFHPISDDYATKPLGVVNWIFIVARDHPLATEPGPLPNEVLRRFPAINVEDTSLRLTKRTAWRLPGQQEFIVPDLRTKVACHVNGLGIGFLPEPLVRSALREGVLVQRPVRSGRSPSPLSLAWRRNGAGKITAYIRSLFEQEDELAAGFCVPLDPDTVGLDPAGSR